MSRVVGAPLLLLVFLSACGDLSAGGAGGFNQGGFEFGGATSDGGGANPGTGGGGGQGSFDYSGLCGIVDCIPGARDDSCLPGNVGGAGGAGGVAGVEQSGCQIAVERELPVALCGPAGWGEASAVCSSSADCGPGLGCVLSESGNEGGGGSQAPSVGQCRPYCCGDLELCPAETFCAPVPLFDAASALPDPNTAIPIPVCTPIVECQLLEDTCGPELTCSIVREDGSTSCVAIGSGRLCQPCPCADGFVCSLDSGTCVQLCDTNSNDCPGTGALCQGGGPLPDGVGLCVLGDADCR